MTCDCNSNKKYVFCQNCIPSEDTWLVPVEEVPDPFFMDRHHAYITKDNRVYVLSEDRTQAKEIGSSNGGGSIDLSNYVTKSELDPYAKKVDAVASTENYFPSVNNSSSKEYNLTMNPFDSKVVSAHLKIDLKEVTLMSGSVESQIQDKFAILYIPVSIADGEHTLTTQTIEIIQNTLWLEISLIVELTPTKMFVETLCYLTYTKNYQTIHREHIDLIGNMVNFSKEMPESETVSYTTRHVPYVGLILTKLKTFK